VAGRSSLDPGRRKVAGYQPDSCKPTHYSILVHMALAKTTLSLISKLKKGSLHVFLFSVTVSRGRYSSMLAKHTKKLQKLGKAKKLGLVLSHYQPLTWV
jgi:hypothetical protein